MVAALGGVVRVTQPIGRAATIHMRVTDGDLLDTFPSEKLTPSDVVGVHLEALQQSNYRLFWRFLSPDCKRATGALRPSGDNRREYLAPPKYHEDPAYAPLLRNRKYAIVGALPIDEESYQCRVRVWPAGGERECAGESVPASPVEYKWKVALQPVHRPVCYEDDPMQQGISTGPPFGGCWLVDSVKQDDRWNDDDRDRLPLAPLPGGGRARRKARRKVAVPRRERTMVQNGR